MPDLGDLSDVLPPDTARTWPHVAACLPNGSMLMGGTALAVHLRHRVSRDLDVFCHDGLDPGRVEAELAKRGPFVRTPPIDERTLNGVFSETKVQFLAVDQRPLRGPTIIAGMPVGSVEDILATKLKVVMDRGELRDYFDLMHIDRAGLPVEYGLILFRERYNLAPDVDSVGSVVRSLGYLDDVLNDPLLAQSAGPDVRTEVIDYWQARHPQVVASLDTGGAHVDDQADFAADLVAAAAIAGRSVPPRVTCDRTVRSTGLPCRLQRGHRGRCRSR